MLQIIELKVVPVVVDRTDPNWIKNLVGPFPSAIELAPANERFPQVADWPEVDHSGKYGIAWFVGESFPSFEAVNQRLTAEGVGLERRTVLPHLISEIVPQGDELWARQQCGEGPAWIFASSLSSFWRGSGGVLYVPCVGLRPVYRELSAFWVECVFGDGFGFLIACE